MIATTAQQATVPASTGANPLILPLDARPAWVRPSPKEGRPYSPAGDTMSTGVGPSIITSATPPIAQRSRA